MDGITLGITPPVLLSRSRGLIQNRVILVAGSGFFTDAYDIFTINIGVVLSSSCQLIFNVVSTLLGYAYFRDSVNNGVLPNSLDVALKVATSSGAIFGQLLFGVLCDKLGRKRVTRPIYSQHFSS